MILADELDKLAELRDAAAQQGSTHTDAKAAFKTHEAHCLDLMEAQRTKSHRGEDGTLFTRVDDRVKGQVEDRRLYIRYCLEQDEGVQAYLDAQVDDADCWGEGKEDALRNAFYDLLIGGLELVAVKEKQDRCNAQARSHIADGAPLPPGLTFRPDPYIQQRRS